MNSIVIGRYIPGNSWIHRLDPRTKIVLTFVYIFALLFANSWASYGVATLFLLLTLYLTKQPWSLYWQGIRPILGLIVFTVILQIFFTAGTPILFQWGWLKITQPGLLNAVLVVIRFVLIILMSTVMTLTTAPTSIASALESLLAPLKKVKVPVAELALMLSIALRFVPLLMDETVKVMNAQKSRGMSFSTGGLIKRAKAIVPLLIPLFVGALQRALDLANAMEVRGFKDPEQRTRYRVLKYGKLDYQAAIAMLIFLIIFVTARLIWG
ncbi:energy-coupling factor transporter transmembrane component T family protein [Eupransor demetentiae]|uniref:Energy-coupling factor transporter transmembrane protein EcfT n=1 Tax=Eupransor demetentiae TaxID=3109584 RepID=A0ABM9N663_9LACO|nr:ECF-type transporter transmembrane protein EcfT (EcfT) [Lactobacillaceae bacterium LMG 33000]